MRTHHMTRLALSALFLVASATAALATDTDGDGLDDASESGAYGTSSTNTDTDGDGVPDWVEVMEWGSDPNDTDTDNDGTADGSEDEHTVLSAPTGPHDGVTAASFTGARTGTPWAYSGESPTDGVGVNLPDGSFHTSLAVAKCAGVRGVSFAASVTYDSMSSWDGYFGKGWCSPFDGYAVQMPNGNMRILMPDGVERTWTWNSPGFTPPAGSVDDLVIDSPSVKVMSPGGNWLEYTIGGGFEGAGDRFGNELDVVWSGGQPTSVVDARGETHTLEFYAATGRVKKVTAADGAAWEFSYNTKGQLWKVKGPATTSFAAGITNEWSYTNGLATASLNGNMLTAWDGGGTAWLRNQYDTSDRVAQQKLGGTSDTILFNWASASSQQATVTDRNGNERVWKWHSTKQTRTELTEKTNRNVRSGEGDYTTLWEHDADGYLTKVTYPRGNGVKYTLSSVKRPTEVRRKADMTAADGSSDLVDAYTHENAAKFYAVATHTDPEGKVTTWTNDTNGQPTGISFPTLTHVTPNVTVSHSYTYNADGTVATFTDGEGKVTEYEYYTTGPRTGRLKKRTLDPSGLNLATEWDYEAWGAVKSVTDARGNTTMNTTERYGNVTKVTAPAALGYETQYTYNLKLLVAVEKVKNIDYDGTWLSAPAWIEKSCSYDGMDQLLSTHEYWNSSDQRSTTIERDANGNATKVSRGDREVRMSYDERDLLYTRTREGGTLSDPVEEYGYDGNRNLTSHKDPRSKTTTSVYDLYDRRTKTVDALGHYREGVYDKRGLVTEAKAYEEAGTTDVLLEHAKASFDAMGRMWKEEARLQGSTDTWLSRTFLHDKRSLVTKRTDRLSNDATWTYDAVGRATLSTDALGNTQAWEYDANGNVTKRTETEKVPGSSSTEAFETSFEYDAWNRMKKQTVIDRTNSSNTKVTEWKRDALSFVRREVDPKGFETHFLRDLLGRTIETRRQMGSSAEIVTQWAYGLNDEVTTLTDDNGSETEYDYDRIGRLTLKTYESTKTVAFEHDAAGNVLRVTDQNGTLIDQGFDDLNRLVARDLTLASGVGGDTAGDFAYDALGRLTSATDDDSTVQFTYDSLSRILTETTGPNPLGSSGRTATSAWDAEGRRTKLTYPSSFEARETRDALGRVTEIKDASNVSIAAWDLYGASLRTKKTTFGNGTTANLAWDGFRRPTEIAHKTSGSSEFAGFVYAWDKNDNPLYEKRSHKSGTGDVYSYDQADRLTRCLSACADPAAEIATPGSQSYTSKLDYNMDDVLNLTSYVTTPYGGSSTTTNYTANAMNEYTAVGGTTHVYTDAGSLKDDGTHLYKYDGFEHLLEVRVKATNALVASYTYDALCRRSGRTVSSKTTRYFHAGDQVIEERDGSSGALDRLYVFGERIDETVAMEAPDVVDVDQDSDTSELKRFHLHGQLIGSVTHVTGPNEAVVETYEYDPYGKITIKDRTGSTVTSSAIGNPYTYTGREYDAETGLYHYRARAYSPELRRFIQRDPKEYVDGPNAIGYVSAMPVASVDTAGTARAGFHTKMTQRGLKRFKFDPDRLDRIIKRNHAVDFDQNPLNCIKHAQSNSMHPIEELRTREGARAATRRYVSALARDAAQAILLGKFRAAEDLIGKGLHCVQDEIYHGQCDQFKIHSGGSKGAQDHALAQAMLMDPPGSHSEERLKWAREVLRYNEQDAITYLASGEGASERFVNQVYAAMMVKAYSSGGFASMFDAALRFSSFVGGGKPGGGIGADGGSIIFRKESQEEEDLWNEKPPGPADGYKNRKQGKEDSDKQGDGKKK